MGRRTDEDAEMTEKREEEEMVTVYKLDGTIVRLSAAEYAKSRPKEPWQMVTEILSGPDFQDYLRNNGHTDFGDAHVALHGKHPAAWEARERIYAHLVRCANGPDYCGNGCDFRQRRSAAQRMLAEWPKVWDVKLRMARLPDPIF